MSTPLQDFLSTIEEHVQKMSPLQASEFLQELQVQLGHFSLSVTRGVIQPMVKAGRTDMLLVPPPSSEIILPEEKKIVIQGV